MVNIEAVYDDFGFQKYIDTFTSTIGFWLFGYSFTDNTSGFVVSEEQDYVLCFLVVLVSHIIMEL